jgi:abortive infection alpha-like protein
MSNPNKTVVESAKATQEVAKTTAKGIDAATAFGEFIARFISGPIEQGMGIFEDKLKYMRWERQVRLIKKATQLLSEVGLDEPTRSIPLKVAIPLLQAASIEDDDNLQDKWAALLVNAANAKSGIEIHRVYVEILGQISPLEAKILDEVYALPFESTQHAGVLTHSLPDIAIADSEESKSDREREPTNEVKLAMSNLERIGCLKLGMTYGGGGSFTRVNPTLLGQAFVGACRVQI